MSRMRSAAWRPELAPDVSRSQPAMAAKEGKEGKIEEVAFAPYAPAKEGREENGHQFGTTSSFDVRIAPDAVS